MTTDRISMPSGLTEQVVAALWAEVLQTPTRPESSANFFELGGDSIAMVTLEFRIKEELSVELPAGTVLGAPTLGELCAAIEAARESFPGVPEAQRTSDPQALTCDPE